MPMNEEGITFVLNVKDDGTATLSKFSGSFKQVDSAVDKVSKSTRDAAKAQKEFEREAKGAEQAARKLRSEQEKAAKSTNALTNSAKSLFLAFASWKSLEWVKDTALLAARYETLGVVMDRVGKNINLSGEELTKYQKLLEKTGISMIQSRQGVIRMIQANIDLSNSFDLARIAQDAAVIGNVNSSEAFERLIYGIQSGNLHVLRTIGINANFENSYKKVAERLGVTTEELDETQKAAARVSEVLSRGKNIAGSYEAAMGTAGKQLLSMQRYAEDARVILGEAFGPATTSLIFELADSTKELAAVFKDPEFQESLKNISMFIADILIGAKELAEWAATNKILINIVIPPQVDALITLMKNWKTIKSEAKAIFEGELPTLSGKQVPEDIYGFDVSKVDDALHKFFDELDDAQEKLFDRYQKNLKKTTSSVDKALKEYFDTWQLDKYWKRVQDIQKAADEARKDTIPSGYQDIWMPERAGKLNQERADVETRALEEQFSKMTKLSEATAQAMQQNFSSFFFDAFQGRLNSLGDYIESFSESVLKSLSNYLGQIFTQKLFGEDFKGGGWLTAIGQWLGSAKGNVLSGSGIEGFENQIVTSPKVFGFAKGVGIIGEGSKPEGVLPLARTSSGDLGVQTTGGGSGFSLNSITVNIIDKSGNQNKVSKVEPRIDLQGLVLDLVLDGADRNVGGFADLLGLRK